mmetsp:Transcript_56065/g.159010  ORF Transcript_56065/g.159010 Transcript_56065/m.159010 type:complete len:213 (+) Transcript_56065:384-1022(+)
MHELAAELAVALPRSLDCYPLLADVRVVPALAVGVAIAHEEVVEPQAVVQLVVFASPAEVVVAEAVDLAPVSQVHADDAARALHVRGLPVVAVDLRAQLHGHGAVGVVDTFLRQIIDVLDHRAIEVEAHAVADVRRCTLLCGCNCNSNVEVPATVERLRIKLLHHENLPPRDLTRKPPFLGEPPPILLELGQVAISVPEGDDHQDGARADGS